MVGTATAKENLERLVPKSYLVPIAELKLKREKCGLLVEGFVDAASLGVL